MQDRPTLSRLLQKQFLFSVLVSRFILRLNEAGFSVTFGEAYRPDELARMYAERGIGVRNSNHRWRLAIDLNLFVGGKYLQETKEYEKAGRIWEKMSLEPEAVELKVRCCWGGDFEDGNHFAFEHNGVR